MKTDAERNGSPDHPGSPELGWAVEESGYSDEQIAAHIWREAVEGIGVTVFVYSLGRDSCNGFSLWHERAPVIAVSSAWREEARIFTLFHELNSARELRVFVDAVQNDLLGRSQAVEYLDIPDTAFDDLADSLSSAR